jgi:hypothetical protein
VFFICKNILKKIKIPLDFETKMIYKITASKNECIQTKRGEKNVKEKGYCTENI